MFKSGITAIQQIPSAATIRPAIMVFARRLMPALVLSSVRNSGNPVPATVAVPRVIVNPLFQQPIFVLARNIGSNWVNTAHFRINVPVYFVMTRTIVPTPTPLHLAESKARLASTTKIAVLANVMRLASATT